MKELDLSHSDFGEYGGKLIGEAIGKRICNRVSVKLFFQERPFEYRSIPFNQNWNLTYFFTLIVGNNDTIETLNISWNGFGPNGAKAIAKGLEVFRYI